MQKKGELADGRYREDIVQKVVVRAGGGCLKMVELCAWLYAEQKEEVERG